MRAKRNLEKQIRGGEIGLNAETTLDDRFGILVEQVAAGFLDAEEASQYRKRFNEALQKAVINNNGNVDELQLTDTSIVILKETRFTKGVKFTEKKVTETKTSLFLEFFKKTVTLLIAVVLITLGFSMIILPAPPYFEMFTIFYFNDQDGVTIMDLISLIIILCGVYLFVTTITKPRKM